MKFSFLWISLIIGTALVAWGEGTTRPSDLLDDSPLADYQGDLLDLAFRAVSKFPTFPHIKNRCLAQEAVVQACLTLDQPQRALRYLAKIDNWRKGTAYADLAFFAVEQGAKAETVEPFLKKAAQVASATEDWPKDRIAIRIAQVYTLLGMTDKVNQYNQNIDQGESSKLAIAQAMVSERSSFEAEMVRLEAQLATKSFDVSRAGLVAGVEYYRRYYERPAYRSRVAATMKTAWEDLPMRIRIELLMKLAEVCLDRQDRDEATKWVKEADALMSQVKGNPRFVIQPMMQLAALQFRSGDRLGAKDRAKKALALYNSREAKIINIDRAQLLVAIAEAHCVFNEKKAALRHYKRAVEAGMVNPNSRPRAQDLSKTCCSMAVYQCEPDEILWKRLKEIEQGLGDPW